MSIACDRDVLTRRVVETSLTEAMTLSTTYREAYTASSCYRICRKALSTRAPSSGRISGKTQVHECSKYTRATLASHRRDDGSNRAFDTGSAAEDNWWQSRKGHCLRGVAQSVNAIRVNR